MADFSVCCGGNPFSFRLRFHDSLFPGAKRLLHLCLPLRRIFRPRRQVVARKNPSHARLQSMRPLHCDLHVKRSGARRGEAIWDGGRSGLHEVHGLRQRLSERRSLFRFRKADDPGSQIKCDQEKLFCNVARRNHRRTGVSGKFPGCSRCLRAGPIPDGARLRHRHDVSHPENVEIVPGKRIVLLPFQSEGFRQNSKSGLGICNHRLCLDWIERAQWLGALSRISGESRVPESSGAGRACPCAGESRPLASSG